MSKEDFNPKDVLDKLYDYREKGEYSNSIGEIMDEIKETGRCATFWSLDDNGFLRHDIVYGKDFYKVK